MTRVDLVAHDLDLYRATGLARYARELARALAATPNWQVTLNSLRPLPADVPVGSREVPGPRRSRLLVWQLAGGARYERLFGPADLLHVTAPVLRVPTRLPLVVTVHDVMPLRFPAWFTRRERVFFRSTLRWAAARAAALVTPSQVVADELVQLLGPAAGFVTVTGEGVRLGAEAAAVDVARALAGWRLSPGHYFMHIGRVTTRKNLTLLVEALRRSPSLPLLVAGSDGLGAQQVRAAARDAGTPVIFTGALEEPLLAGVLARAGALVHPSLHEGFGLTPVEAMARGVPVLASTGGALPEVVGDGGVLLDPGDPDAWAAAMTRVAADPAWRASLVSSARARAEAFTWERVAARTAAVYARVLGTGPR
ncbi:MAG: glycosyltransferase family 4 protein [Mycobacteriales bacterium]